MSEGRILPVCTVTDPEERKRRLSRVYTILLDLAARQEAAERASAANELPSATEATTVTRQ